MGPCRVNVYFNLLHHREVMESFNYLLASSHLQFRFSASMTSSNALREVKIGVQNSLIPVD
jgi:hypothetical protein